MNKRINELMLESGYAAPELAGRANKLAELIVAECLVTLDSITSGDRDTLWVARKVIADHFGVEE